MAQAAVMGLIPTMPAAEDLGEVGAAYGAAAAIISGLAFVAVVVSMVGQRRQLRWQQQELTAQQAQLEEQKVLLSRQTAALVETSRAQRDAAGSLQGQLAHLRARARLDDYDRRLARLVEAQAELDDGSLDASMNYKDARARLGHRYWACLLNLLRELSRLRSDRATAAQAKELERDLRTSIERERSLLYLAVVPQDVPPHYKPSELGRLLVSMDLLPYVGAKDTGRRWATFSNHFLPLRNALRPLPSE